ncbi:MAG: response regulator [Gemmatimonadales bacterium]
MANRVYCVLFVDDDQILLRALSNYFKKLGHDVLTAETGRDGIAMFEQYAPDVAVVDLNLPDVSGMDLLAELRRRNAMVIMLTGMGQVENAVEAMRLGAETFLTKPVEMSHLVVAVEKAAEKAELRKENVELRRRLSPSLKRVLTRVAIVVALAAASAVIGVAIGSSGAEDPRIQVPIPLPIDTGNTGR